MSEKQAEHVTDDPLGELITELEYRVEDFQRESERHGALNEWGALKVARAALREYVDALVKGGITAQIADLLEQVAALEIVIDSKEQVIEAMRARIDALQAELASETRWAKQYHDQWQAALSDLRELQE
jgi:chromosome segregation ATPase